LNNSNGRAAGGGADSTGGPNSSGNCGSCHAGGAYNPRLDVSFRDSTGANVVTSWLPNKTYTIRVQVVAQAGAPAGYGFQMIPYTLANVAVANFAATGHSANVQISTLGGRKYAEQNTRSANNVFDTKWVAPAAGSGAIRFYISGNAVNGVNGQAGDSPINAGFNLAEGRVNVKELPNEAFSFKLAPNAADLSTEIRLQSTLKTEATIDVLSMNGSIVSQQKWTIEQGENRKMVDISSLSAGFYVVKVNYTGGGHQEMLFKK
jgi:hypothetical protein